MIEKRPNISEGNLEEIESYSFWLLCFFNLSDSLHNFLVSFDLLLSRKV